MNGKILASLLLVCPLSAAMAQTPLPAEFTSCRQIPEAAARLRCYDALVDGRGEVVSSEVSASAATRTPATMSAVAAVHTPATVPAAATPEPAPVVRERASVAPTARERVVEAKRVQSRVVSFSRDRRGKAIVVLDNNEIWVETSASKFIGQIAPGAAVTLTREGLGWYRLRIDGAQGVMAVRRAR